MPTIVSQLDSAFRVAIRSALGIDADPMVSPAQNDKFGDYQANAAMGLAKQAGEQSGQKANPRALAEQIKSKLDLGEMASEITIAGPGFLNVKLSPVWLSRQLQTIAGDQRLGVEPTVHPQTVVVDYSGPNVAKQMHVGHLRSTIIGDAISRVLEFEGDRVIRQNHIGDWGTQFGMLISHLAGTTGNSQKIEDLEEFYRAAKRRFDEDPAFQNAARQTVVRLQSGGEHERALWQKIVEETRRDYQPIYGRLNVLLKPEHERGESFYNSRLSPVVFDLERAGIAVESDGAVAVFIDGPEKTPLIIEKTGGGYLYGTTDLAAIRYRVNELHATRIIYTHDSRQAQHFGQVFATAKKAGWAEGISLEYAPFGTMLGEDGRPFKTRTGGTVKLKDLLDEAEERAFQLVTEKNAEMPEPQRRTIARAIGIGAVKYSDLSKDRTSDYMFSWDKMLSMDGNTGPYLQYAYARIRSIFRKTAEKPDPTRIVLDSPQELTLAKHILRLADVLEIVSRELKPHHLCLYLYELAQKFSSFYEHCPVLKSEDAMRASRLALCDLTARTMALGLDLLGIEHPDQM
jgi:arginyl-tRNA synthetase